MRDKAEAENANPTMGKDKEYCHHPSFNEGQLPKVTQTFERMKFRRKSPPKTSINRKGLCKHSQSRRCKHQRHNTVPFLKIPLENIPMDQLYTFTEPSVPEVDKGNPVNNSSVEFSTLSESGPYKEDQIPQI